MAKQPELVTTAKEAGHPVAWKCSECDAPFTLILGLPANEEKVRVLHEQFEHHVKKEHNGC
jgi:hypothetical protein